MAKTDYTKMENLLNEGLLKMTINELLDLADKASSFKEPQSVGSLPSLQARGLILALMESELKTLSKVEGVDFAKIGITPKALKDMAKNLEAMKADQWTRLKEIRENLKAYKLELSDKIPHLSDEELIELERKKHINKRYNVRDKWLPLH